MGENPTSEVEQKAPLLEDKGPPTRSTVLMPADQHAGLSGVSHIAAVGALPGRSLASGWLHVSMLSFTAGAAVIAVCHKAPLGIVAGLCCATASLAGAVGACLYLHRYLRDGRDCTRHVRALAVVAVAFAVLSVAFNITLSAATLASTFCDYWNGSLEKCTAATVACQVMTVAATSQGFFSFWMFTWLPGVLRNGEPHIRDRI
ncbi:unnamed protein product [Ostreobium quekettii]|uniref:Transmembrane protein n=1 Tax=Ostreobium quekettii TaxID=121088 RepID=A0A8S1J1Y0_9CHLO|nr:unnamed protein product [Ostreobium quekettii]